MQTVQINLQLYAVYSLWNRRKTLTGSPDPTHANGTNKPCNPMTSHFHNDHSDEFKLVTVLEHVTNEYLSVADLRFSCGGGTNSQSGRANLFFCKFFVQGLFVPFARVGSGDPVRVLRLLHTNTLDTIEVFIAETMYNLSPPNLMCYSSATVDLTALLSG